MLFTSSNRQYESAMDKCSRQVVYSGRDARSSLSRQRQMGRLHDSYPTRVRYLLNPAASAADDDVVASTDLGNPSHLKPSKYVW